MFSKWTTVHMHFIKAGFHNKISHISETQNHLQKKSNLHISISQTLIQKTQFATMTDPVPTRLTIIIITHFFLGKLFSYYFIKRKELVFKQIT